MIKLIKYAILAFVILVGCIRYDVLTKKVSSDYGGIVGEKIYDAGVSANKEIDKYIKPTE